MPLATDRRPQDFLVRKLKRILPLPEDDACAVESLPVTIRTLAARQDIVRDGDRPSQACLILDGWACGYKLIEGGRRQILSFHVPGDAPDLLNLRMGIADFSIGTLTKATVAFIPHDALRPLSMRHAAATAALWHLTLVDAAVFRQWMTGLGRRPAIERLAHLFCELYLKQRALGQAEEGSGPLPITQTDLADALGMTSVHVNRVLKDMRRQGLVTLGERMLSSERWPSLMSVANFDPTYLHLETLEPI